MVVLKKNLFSIGLAFSVILGGSIAGEYIDENRSNFVKIITIILFSACQNNDVSQLNKWLDSYKFGY